MPPEAAAIGLKVALQRMLMTLLILNLESKPQRTASAVHGHEYVNEYHHPEDPMELVYIKPQVFGMCIFMVVSNMFYFRPYLGKMNPF